MARSAHWLASAMRAAGLEARILPTGDAWAVLGEGARDPAAPTVLVYSHHDVRHAKPEQWHQTDPFTAARRDGRLYGRGASDAKGQVLAHLWALRAHRAASPHPVNVVFLVEGEEEMGSPHLAQLIAEHADDLACDLVVFSDTLQWRDDAPAPVTSIRGILTATVTVVGPERDVHSRVASGVTLNPAFALARLLSRIHDDEGRIALPGFYDDVEPLSAERRRELAALPYDADAWTERTGTRQITGERGFTPLERLWARLTVEVLSLLSGDPGDFDRSVIPARATLSIRTVPRQRIQRVADQLRRFVADAVPDDAAYELSVDEAIAQEPLVSPSGPVLDALERALAAGFGTAPRGRMGNAGGGPAELLSTRLHVPVYFLGTGPPEGGWHGADESVDIDTLLAGARTIAHFWDELSVLGRDAIRESDRIMAETPTGVPPLVREAALRFVRDGYLFGIRGYRDAGADAFRTRLLGRNVVVARGAEAVHVFGSGFQRTGAVPRSASHLLQDEGSVQSLEGPRHDARKELMVEIALHGRAPLVDLFHEEWEAAAERRRGSRVSLLDLGTDALARAALRWVGLPSAAGDATLAGDLRVMVDRAASVGPVNWAARVRRRRAEAWARRMVEDARAWGDEETAVGRVSHFREDGRMLPAPIAAVELLNLVRPVVAVARFIAFAGHALQRRPEWARRIRNDEILTGWMAEEIRRFYPFFPMIGGVSTRPFHLCGERFPAGRWMLLDLYGTDHDPRIWGEPERFDPARFEKAPDHAVVAQGVGDMLTSHHCPGERATTDLVAAALEELSDRGWYTVPDQDLRISLRRIPAQPQDGMLIDIR
ncbi:M20/M25/M40 family metallo-hydrolase [Microbacterium sp. EF45047]|nr:M20/M25/M40 family metallo-hydrolase [Microbacterium neungamense]WCM54663.1 M20/M25/M40 family metallo-hydrolase [Microbacterium sp. EF45047]